MSYVFVFIIHEDLNAALSGLVFSEDNSLLLLAVNPITLLGQGECSVQIFLEDLKKIILCG